MGKRTRSAGVGLSLVIGLGLLGGCRIPPRTNTAADLGAAGPSAIAVEAESRAHRTSARKARAEAWLDAAEAWLAAERPAEAERVLRLARKAYHAGPTAARNHRLLGHLHLMTGEVAIAERYLLKGLESADGEERESTIARLVACAAAQADSDAETRYRSWLIRPFSPETNRILSQAIDPVSIESRSSYLDSLIRRESESVRIAPPAVQRETSAPSTRAGPRIPPELLSVHPLPRSRWHPRPVALSNSVPMSRIHRITVHHTAGPSFWGHDEQSVANEIRRIQRYHQKDQGWADIGYHFLIDRTGRIWQGRELQLQGAHARDKNAGNIGIAVLGNYMRQDLTAAQRESLRDFLRVLCARYEIPPREIYTHREICNGQTACPGPNLARFVDETRVDLRHEGVVAYGK